MCLCNFKLENAREAEKNSMGYCMSKRMATEGQLPPRPSRDPLSLTLGVTKYQGENKGVAQPWKNWDELSLPLVPYVI